MTSTSDLDQTLKVAINLLHSPNPKAAEDIRICLDEIIKQRYGPAKMLVNTISKKHLDEEPLAPTVITIPETASDEIISLINSPTKTISDTDEGVMLATNNEDVENLKEFGDLKCVVCCEMMFTATNRLVECHKCGSLYHQECHRPHITDEEAEPENPWQCTQCTLVTAANVVGEPATGATTTTTPLTTSTAQAKSVKSSASSSSRSSSSSTSSSPFYRHEQSSTQSSTKHHKSSSKSGNHHRNESPMTPGSSSSKVAVPNINVISANEKVSSHSTSRKSHSSGGSNKSSSSSSKSSSKHHESGSSKRKSAK